MKNNSVEILDTNKYLGRSVLRASPPDSLDVAAVGMIMKSVISTHEHNVEQSKYLYNFYRGDQPVLTRTKKIRSDICNIMLENRAFEIVQFKIGYEHANPVTYTSASKKDVPVDVLNDFTRLDGKQAKDVELAEWQYVTGTSYKLCLPNLSDSPDEAPYFTDVLDPQSTFVVYSNAVGKKPLLGGICVTQKVKQGAQEVDQFVYAIYTPNKYFEWTFKKENGDFTKVKPTKEEDNPLGMIPIVEYPLNRSRLGYVDICHSLYNALNTVGSNRIDALEQFVQSFMVFLNCEMPTDKDGNKIPPRTGDAIDVKGVPGLPADVKYLVQQLNQADAQVTKDDVLSAIYEICGVPTRNDRSSGGSTGYAEFLRNGWGAAEARARTTEKFFKASEMEYLKIVLRICRDTANVSSEIGDMTLRDIEVQLPRNRNDSMQIKATTLATLLSIGIDGEEAIETVEMFADPKRTWDKSKDNIIAIFKEKHDSFTAELLKNISTMLSDEYVDEEWAINKNPLIEDKEALIARMRAKPVDNYE